MGFFLFCPWSSSPLTLCICPLAFCPAWICLHPTHSRALGSYLMPMGCLYLVLHICLKISISQAKLFIFLPKRVLIFCFCSLFHHLFGLLSKKGGGALSLAPPCLSPVSSNSCPHSGRSQKYETCCFLSICMHSLSSDTDCHLPGFWERGVV